MRWRLDVGGEFLRFVDADEIRTAAHRGREFLRRTDDDSGYVVVFTISPLVHVQVTPVPTFRMVGGPKDGQVCAAPFEVPERIHFQTVVALDGDGLTLVPVPPRMLPELSEVYVHHPWGCPCRGRMGAFEHVYVWPPVLYEQTAKAVAAELLGVEMNDGGAPV